MINFILILFFLQNHTTITKDYNFLIFFFVKSHINDYNSYFFTFAKSHINDCQQFIFIKTFFFFLQNHTSAIANDYFLFFLQNHTFYAFRVTFNVSEFPKLLSSRQLLPLSLSVCHVSKNLENVPSSVLKIMRKLKVADSPLTRPKL